MIQTQDPRVKEETTCSKKTNQTNKMVYRNKCSI